MEINKADKNDPDGVSMPMYRLFTSVYEASKFTRSLINSTFP